MTPVGTPSGDFPDQNPILDVREKTKKLSFSEPFVSLTSFDARTKPCPTHIPGLHLCLYLTACSLYNIINGFQLGQNVQKIDTEVQPSYMLELMETSIVSFSMGIIFVTRKTENCQATGTGTWDLGPGNRMKNQESRIETTQSQC